MTAAAQRVSTAPQNTGLVSVIRDAKPGTPILMQVFSELAPENMRTHTQRGATMTKVLDTARELSDLPLIFRNSAAGTQVAHELDVTLNALISGRDFSNPESIAKFKERLTDVANPTTIYISGDTLYPKPAPRG